ncbi:MAG TPA: leucine-rich repeat-containing protein kinase family protein [Hydrogenophaga sp.]|nr:leucine-rich repeat-containing protein kinase family protein [Hydrogenophaga sp.]
MHTLEQLRSGALSGTRRLDLSCDLTVLPPEVLDLADTLEVLNLTGNRLSALPPDLGRLRKLRIIFCSSNAFTELPEVLGDCADLEMVGFKANRIANVPSAALPPKLRWLILTDNAIDRLPEELGQRPAMQKLMLAGNRLSALPAGLADAHSLELLRLSANRFTELPRWLTRLPRLAWLAVAGNPLGWQHAQAQGLPRVAWHRLRLVDRLGEGASGHIHRVHIDTEGAEDQTLALKLFKGSVTSDGLPEHEIAACAAAGHHPALCTPVAELADHPDGTPGLLMPIMPPELQNLAGPPSFQSCTRDVYPEGFAMDARAALRVSNHMAHALAHLHRRGVMHGDFYAHNILWNSANGDAMLSDFGGASVLPDDQPELRRELLALDVRALGCLLEELAAHEKRDAAAGATIITRMAGLAAACMNVDPAARPNLEEVVEALDALDSAHTDPR